MQHNFFKTVLYFALSFAVFGLNTSYAQSGCSVVIHAISINPGDCNGGVDCDSPSEYIEIFNPCFEPLDLGCSAICEGSWCVSMPSGTVLMPGEYLALGSVTSPGFDAENSKHIDLHNCNGCAWRNTASETVELGALSDEKGQIALFDAEGKLLQGLVWGGGQSPIQADFPVDLIIEESGGCAARALTLPNPASNEQFTEIKEIEDGCSFSIKANNEISSICNDGENEIAIGATTLRFLPFTVSGCLYTGETVNITLNTEGMAGAPYWTIPCTNEFPDINTPSTDVFCDLPGVKSIYALVLNEANGYTYQYQEEIEILPGLDEAKDFKDQEVCVGEDVKFEIPTLEGLDSQVVVVNNPPYEPIILTSDFMVDVNFTIDIQDIEETSTVTYTGYSSENGCELEKEVTITVLPADDAYCSTPVEEYMLLYSSVNPNPAKNFVQILYELKQNSESELSLYNVFGQKVSQQKALSYAGKNQQNIDIEKLPAGIYMLRLTLQNETHHFKFIKE